MAFPPVKPHRGLTFFRPVRSRSIQHPSGVKVRLPRPNVRPPPPQIGLTEHVGNERRAAKSAIEWKDNIKGVNESTIKLK